MQIMQLNLTERFIGLCSKFWSLEHISTFAKSLHLRTHRSHHRPVQHKYIGALAWQTQVFIYWKWSISIYWNSITSFSLINFLLSNPIGNQLAVANKRRHLSVLNSEFGWPGRKVYPERTHPALSGIQLFCMNVGNGLVTCIAYVICVHTCLKSKPVAAKAKGKRAEFAQTSRLSWKTLNQAFAHNNGHPRCILFVTLNTCCLFETVVPGAWES